ncbi:hypothetical protein [Methylobacterium aerolatum]|uniref:Uncharacterized protein n=1 Tax=Methylobacterium aerolatum TaxID=418708 RepID=A0ABU0I2K7_9HYPH|nr:hypothetical protein [Methylobacterium aerolatum]MDQ0448834.1 hypothetical protein [Methylobacterium aerolatum]
MSDIHASVLRFREFLNASKPIAEAAADGGKDYLLDDWLQANWEVMVEARTEKYILHYGEGADCNGTSCRVWLPEILPTHQIACRDLTSGLQHKFIKFIRWDGQKYSEDTPLTHILCNYDPLVVLVIEQVELILVECEPM